VIIGRLEPAVVETERLARGILEVKLAVVVTAKVRGCETPRAVRIESPI
jgi:hypothetical protein